MTAGYPSGLCAIGSSALPGHHPGCKQAAGCSPLDSKQGLGNLFPTLFRQSGERRVQWKAQSLSRGDLNHVVPAQGAPKTEDQ